MLASFSHLTPAHEGPHCLHKPVVMHPTNMEFQMDCLQNWACNFLSKVSRFIDTRADRASCITDLRSPVLIQIVYTADAFQRSPTSQVSATVMPYSPAPPAYWRSSCRLMRPPLYTYLHDIQELSNALEPLILLRAVESGLWPT